jgi:hypothetical protein
MTDEKVVNGSTQPAMLRTVLNENPGTRIIYTLSNGMYLGSIRIDMMSADALKAMAQDFQAFVAEQTGGIQQVPAGALSRLSKPS